MAAAVVCLAFQQPHHRGGKARPRERLEQIVNCIQLEGIDRILVKGRGEYDLRKVVEPAQHFQPGHLEHPDIYEHHACAVERFTHQTQGLVGTDRIARYVTRQRFVLGGEGGHQCHA